MNSEGDIRRFASGEDRGDYKTPLTRTQADHLGRYPVETRAERHAAMMRTKNGCDFKRLKRTGRL